MPAFSIIIPTYNRRLLLQQTLNSVWQQAFTDFEVIVIDDGSTDGTVNFLQSLAGRVKTLTQANRGPGAARNLGAHHATGEYLAFLDSDDLWFPWSLELYRNVINQTARPSFIAGKPRCFRAESELAAVTQSSLRVEQFPDYLASSDAWRWWGVSSFVVRRDMLFEAGGFTEKWVNGEDADLALRLGTAPGFVQITSPETFGYREHEISAMKNFRCTLAGAWLKVQAEKSSAYPGGDSRSMERRRILTRHLRPIVLESIKRGLRNEAWELYRATLAWNAALGRFKYLFGVPLLAIFSCLRSSTPSMLQSIPRDR